MAMRIRQYTVSSRFTKHECALPMPVGSRILSVKSFNGVPCLYALVDDEKPVETRAFIIIPNEREIIGLTFHAVKGNNFEYIGTWNVGEGIFHLIELKGGPSFADIKLAEHA